jgi:hypothetical protein
MNQHEATSCWHESHLSCSDNVWTRFELEQEEILPGSVRQIVRQDGIEIYRTTYKRTFVVDAVSMNVYVSNMEDFQPTYGVTHGSAGSRAEVRNFFIEGLICEDPCQGKNQCESFLDSCQQQSQNSKQLGSFSIPTDYILSFDVNLASDASDSSGEWRSIIEFGDGLSLDCGRTKAGRVFILQLYKDGRLFLR